MKFNPKITVTYLLLLTSLFSYSQHLSVFEKDGKQGILKNGKREIQKARYDHILKFNTIADSNSPSKQYFISNIGGEYFKESIDTIIYEDYDYSGNLNQNTIDYHYTNYLMGGKFGLIGPNGKTILKTIYDSISIPQSIEKEIPWLYQNLSEKTEKVKIKKDSEIIYLDFFINDKVPILANKDGKWGLLNFEGDIILDFNYDSYIPKFVGETKGEGIISFFIKGKLVSIYDLLNNRVLFNIEDESINNFDLIIPFAERHIKDWNPYDDTTIQTYIGDTYYLISKGGEINRDSAFYQEVARYDMEGDFIGSIKLFKECPPYIKGGKLGIMGPKGDIRIEPKYDNFIISHHVIDNLYGNETSKEINLAEINNYCVDYDFKNIDTTSLIITVLDNKFGLMDITGNNLVENKYDSIDYYVRFWFFINDKKLSLIYNNDSKNAIFQVDDDVITSIDYCLYLSETNDIIKTLSDIYQYSTDSISAVLENAYYLINSGGVLKPNQIKREIEWLDEYGNYQGYKSVYFNRGPDYLEGGEFGILNSHGQIIIEPIYDSICVPFIKKNYDGESGPSFYDNVSIKSKNWFRDEVSVNAILNTTLPFILFKDGKWGAIDITGNIVEEFKYDTHKELQKRFFK